jgi:hypothetical protein
MIRPPLTDPRLRLDRPLYYLLNARDAVCAWQVWQGECVLLFTSSNAAATFADSSGIQDRPPLVFSSSRSEFLTRAGRYFEQGFIGGLIDPTVGPGQTAFVGFEVGRWAQGA